MKRTKKPIELWLDLGPSSNSSGEQLPTKPEEDNILTYLPENFIPHVADIYRGPLGRQDVAEVELEDDVSQKEAISLIGLVPIVLVRCKDWTMIPLENLVAAADGNGTTRIGCVIETAKDLPGAASALEIGIDIFALPPCKGSSASVRDDIDALWTAAIEEKLSRPSHHSSKKQKTASSSSIEDALVTWSKVVSVAPGGLVGERVCIDLIERLVPGEGAYVGSVSNHLCLVHSECIPSQYVATRPFRINAGPVSSYVLMADGKTKYLSEIKGGDQIIIATICKMDTLVVKHRAVTVGRAKIERRPFILVEFEHRHTGEKETSKGQILLQQAETVRLMSHDHGTAKDTISVTELRCGDEILTRLDTDTKMRHLGAPIKSGEASMREQ